MGGLITFAVKNTQRSEVKPRKVLKIAAWDQKYLSRIIDPNIEQIEIIPHSKLTLNDQINSISAHLAEISWLEFSMFPEDYEKVITIVMPKGAKAEDCEYYNLSYECAHGEMQCRIIDKKVDVRAYLQKHYPESLKTL